MGVLGGMAESAMAECSVAETGMFGHSSRTI